MAKQPRPSERTDRIVACRVTLAQFQQLLAAAQVTDQNVSEYLRDVLFAATEASADALEKAYTEGAREAQADAHRERAAVEAELDRERQLSVSWQQRAGQLERDLRITSGRLTLAIKRVLENHVGARAELARLWACLGAKEQERVLPVLATEIVERVHDVCLSAGKSDLKHVLAVDAKARWLSAMLTRAFAGARSAAPAQAQVTSLALGVATMLLTDWYLRRIGYLAEPTTAEPPAAPEPPPIAATQWSSDLEPLVAGGLEEGDASRAAAAFSLCASREVGPQPVPVIKSPEPTAADRPDCVRDFGCSWPHSAKSDQGL